MAQALAYFPALFGEPDAQQPGNQQPEQRAVADGPLVLAELEELQQIAAADGDRARPQYRRRSWELMEHARDCRAVKIAQQKAESEKRKRQKDEWWPTWGNGRTTVEHAAEHPRHTRALRRTALAKLRTIGRTDV